MHGTVRTKALTRTAARSQASEECGAACASAAMPPAAAMSSAEAELVQSIHGTPGKAVFYAAGGGAQACSQAKCGLCLLYISRFRCYNPAWQRSRTCFRVSQRELLHACTSVTCCPWCDVKGASMDVASQRRVLELMLTYRRCPGCWWCPARRAQCWTRGCHTRSRPWPSCLAPCRRPLRAPPRPPPWREQRTGRRRIWRRWASPWLAWAARARWRPTGQSRASTRHGHGTSDPVSAAACRGTGVTSSWRAGGLCWQLLTHAFIVASRLDMQAFAVHVKRGLGFSVGMTLGHETFPSCGSCGALM